MKRFWLVLLSLGLIMAFSASAFAVDVKFSGSYFAAGAYLDQGYLVRSTGPTAPAGTYVVGTAYRDQALSTAFYFQKLQLTTEFVAAPGLSLVTRANILERVWGGNRSNPVVGGTVTSANLDSQSAATRAENENIGFDYAYIDYTSPIGRFKVGYQNDNPFGCTFGDTATPRGRITYILPIGKFQILGVVTKMKENSLSAVTAANQSDLDYDKYAVAAIFTDKNVETGILAAFLNNATARVTYVPGAANTSNKGKFYALVPYIKANFGPIAIQAEIDYWFGRLNEYDDMGGTTATGAVGNRDRDVESLAGFIDVLGTFGKVYVGGTFAYAQGQGVDQSKMNTQSVGGQDWNPALILFNQDLSYWAGFSNGTLANANVGLTNAFLYQLRAGVRPTDKLDIGASVTFAQRDKRLVGTDQFGYSRYIDGSRDLGWEIDVTGTYKITNNLSYMLGLGYLITGDAFKNNNASATLGGTQDQILGQNNSISNDYLVINKLTLTF
jgi:hypothetical protein